MLHKYILFEVWIEGVSIARPLVPERDVNVAERKVFPTEVSLVVFERIFVQHKRNQMLKTATHGRSYDCL
jgi:hypothetical protein